MSEDGQDVRALRRGFEAVTQGTRRFGSRDEVLRFYAAPLARLFGPDQLGALQVFGPEASDNVDVLLVEAMQESLLVRLGVDWATALGAAWKTLLELTFFGSAAESCAGQAGMVQQCALRTVSRVLATASGETLEQTVQLCVTARERISLGAMVAAVGAEPNRARARVAWTEALRLLGALPDRVANTTKGDVPQTLRGECWIDATLVRGLGDALQHATDKPEVELLRDVLVRLDRSGHLSRAADSSTAGFWPTILRTTATKSTTTTQWAKLRRVAGSSLRKRLDTTLLQTLQHAAMRGFAGTLVAPTETGKPGTEGSAFLSSATHAVVAASAHVMGIFIPPNSPADESDSDTDTEALHYVRTLKCTALSRVSQSPVLAWAWATYLLRAPVRDRLDCLTAALGRWADTARLARVLVDEELFLSTLIVCILASIASGSRELEDALVAVAHSRAVLDGVSAHLAHADPLVRRTGMLVGELLSERTARPGGKTLSFGAAIWNGTGEGREEARVLRALYHAWSHHSDAIAVRAATFKHDSAAVDTLFGPQQVVASSTLMSTVRAERKRSDGPKTRRLPQRVDARDTRTRPLISVIGDSDDEAPLSVSSPREGPLRMFSNHVRPHTPSESSSSSSDSDSDADDADQHEMHKLAADLAGVSTDDAASLFASAKPSSSRATAGVGDMDADREAHAPQFDKRVRAPVYVSQLAPLLKTSSRQSVRMGLRSAAALVARKAPTRTFGGEVDENAVDLTLALAALHDNFGIRRFEDMRRAALVEVACAAPVRVVGVLTEQVFGSQYSGVQRTAMLYALTEAAVRLSRAEQHGKAGHRAEAVAARVVSDTRRVGEQRVPQLRRERQLRLDTSRTTLVQEIRPGTSLAVDPDGRGWAAMAGAFVFPLLNRYLAYQALPSRGSLFEPDSLALLFDTLGVLISLAPATVLRPLGPVLLEALATLLISPSAGPETAAALSALAIFLHAHLELDSAASLLNDRTSVRMLKTLLPRVQMLFTQLNAHTGGTPAKVAARAATVLLQMDQLDQAQTQTIQNTLGFIPA
ncbi:hypothetical protein PaG_00792 [Moesziomyces aphidis]|uniref:Telomere length regulation protein conserved domain-containing protein n=1 Tax=Moesziomyces aphidis TaxID=84754 RepID=W3VTE6_MOEAP|nr:hypothetical protein PaG_00792 [Moesziomyces aphidis]